jgi:hypothetical protein
MHIQKLSYKASCKTFLFSHNGYFEQYQPLNYYVKLRNFFHTFILQYWWWIAIIPICLWCKCWICNAKTKFKTNVLMQFWWNSQIFYLSLLLKKYSRFFIIALSIPFVWSFNNVYHFQHGVQLFPTPQSHT